MVTVGVHRVATQSGSADGGLIGGLVALAVHQPVGRFRVRTVQPAGLQFLAVEVHGPDVGVGIVATAEDAAGVLVGTCEVGCGCQVALASIAVVALVVLAAAVVPVEGAGSLAQFGLGIAVGIVGDGVDGLARQSLEHGQVFLTAVNATVAGAPTLRIACCLDLLVGSRLVDVVTLSVDGGRSRLAHHLCLAVAIVVIHLELRVVGTGPDVRPQADAPQFRAVEFVAVDEHHVGDAALRIVLRRAGIPFHEQFVFAVTVNIAHTHIVGAIGAALGTCLRTVEGQFLVEHLPWLHGLGGLGDVAVHSGDDLVLRRRLAAGILVVGLGQPRGDGLPVAQQVEGGCGLVVGAEETPTDEVLIQHVGYGHQSPVQFLQLAPGRNLCARCQHQGCQEGGDNSSLSHIYLIITLRF